MKNLFFAFLFLSQLSYSQAFKFDLMLQSNTISGLPGVQSYSFGQSNGKILIVGGRLDGLHQRQPFASFDLAGHNENLIVIDPVTLQHWSVSMSTLNQSVREHLRTTNALFIQDSVYLYVLGGYGYSTTAANHKTFDNITVIHLPGIINAIINNQSVSSFIYQSSDSRFAVTGGRMGKIDDVFYIVGGQKFDGRYNPMGNPTFTQVYTNDIRKFKMSFNGSQLTINHLPTINDPTNLHRRDFNVAPQILPNGEEGLTAFSGVFQTNVDLPFLNCVEIDSSGHNVNNSFTQYYNHYECAFMPVYSEQSHQMNTIFFGGIARYYESNGSLITDDNVPFVKTIARVERNSSGVMSEHKLPVEMPGYLGAGAHFIAYEALSSFKNGVLKLDSLNQDTNLVGYIFGGINSSAANIFFVNNGTQSSASTQLFKVFLIKNPSASTQESQLPSVNYFQLQAFPNPFEQNLEVNFFVEKASELKIELFSSQGVTLYSKSEFYKSGYFDVKISNLDGVEQGLYFLKLSDSTKSQILKIVKR